MNIKRPRNLPKVTELQRREQQFVPWSPQQSHALDWGGLLHAQHPGTTWCRPGIVLLFQQQGEHRDVGSDYGLGESSGFGTQWTQILVLWLHSWEPWANCQTPSARREECSLACRVANHVYRLCSRMVALLFLGEWKRKQNEQGLRKPLCFFSPPFLPQFSLTLSVLQMQQTTPWVFSNMLCCTQMVAKILFWGTDMPLSTQGHGV